MIYAIVKDNVTINLIEWDGIAELKLPEGEILVPQAEAPEYRPQPIKEQIQIDKKPQSDKKVKKEITPAQFRIWLIRNKIDIELIDKILQQVEPEKLKKELMVRWEFGLSIAEDSEIIKLFLKHMNLSQEKSQVIISEASKIL